MVEHYLRSPIQLHGVLPTLSTGISLPFLLKKKITIRDVRSSFSLTVSATDFFILNLLKERLSLTDFIG